MYSLPTEKQLSEFVERYLIQVCFGASDIVLNFDRDMSIRIFDWAAVRVGPDNVGADGENFVLCLVKLAGQKISSIRVEKESVVFVFSNSVTVYIRDTSMLYETIQFVIDERTMIVV